MLPKRHVSSWKQCKVIKDLSYKIKLNKLWRITFCRIADYYQDKLKLLRSKRVIMHSSAMLTCILLLPFKGCFRVSSVLLSGVVEDYLWICDSSHLMLIVMTEIPSTTLKTRSRKLKQKSEKYTRNTLHFKQVNNVWIATLLNLTKTCQWPCMKNMNFIVM